MTNYESTLFVSINGVPAGTVSQHRDGNLSFVYRSDYQGPPLSLSMPVSNRAYGDKTVRPYLFGLLPDDASQRQELGKRFGVSGNNPVALLNFIGMDCPGAVQFGTSENRQTDEPSAYKPVKDTTIAQDLKRIASTQEPSWQMKNEHWSLGGSQAKIALAKFGDDWYRCEGAAATTHIIKPGIAGLFHQALNECICLNLAEACGVYAAHATFERFGDERAVVLERFDRIVHAPFEVERLHQEDFCQALGVLPENKYASEGGPSARDVLEILEDKEHETFNKRAFTAQLFFNCLIGATDAHAKNFSVLLFSKGPQIAPLYDCASSLAYDAGEVGRNLAMGIGGETKIGRIRRSHIVRYAQTAGLDGSACINVMANLAERILDSIERVFSRYDGIDGAAELADRMIPAISELCRRTLGSLG